MKSLCARFLTGLAVLLAAGVNAQAQFSYTTNNGAITITRYTGTNDNVVVPSAIDGLRVTIIGTNAFDGSSITSVTIPDGVTNIGDYAFANCYNPFNGYGLTDVAFGRGLVGIGAYAFFNCHALTNVSFGSNVVGIGAYSFSGTAVGSPGLPWVGCPLTSITIPDSVTSIGDHAFYWCSSLTNVFLGGGVTNIGNSAFGGCPLLAIDVAAGSRAYSSLAGVLFNRNRTTLIEYPGGLGGSYTIPNSVTNIANYAFYDCTGLTNVLLDNGLVSIGANAFSGDPFVDGAGGFGTSLACGLATVTVPKSVISIGDDAFAGCILLDTLFFAGNAPSVGSAVFGPLFGPNGYWPLDTTTAYYLPGTSGWAGFATNTGIPTALWTLPHPLVLQGSVGVQSNQFGFTVSWATNFSVVVEASTDLSKNTWTPLQTNALNNGVVNFTDPQWTKYPRRFYRVRSQ